MNDRVPELATPAPEGGRPPDRPFHGGRAVVPAALLATTLGSLGLVLGLLFDPRQALFSYLIAVAYALGLVLGATAFVLAMHAAGATWPVAVRRLPEAVMGVLPLFLLLFVPLAIGAELLYPWMHPERIADEHVRHLVEHKRPYLNLPFVALRAILFIGYWTVVAELLRRWSFDLDRPPPAADLDHHLRLKHRMRVLASAALPAFGLFGTMIAWDWLMSLSPEWYSTMFGLNYLVGGFLGAVALIAVLTALARRSGHLRPVGSPHFYALGRLLFAFLVLWAYTWYWQYFLIWIANRPLEVQWFVVRSQGQYGAVAVLLIAGHFALPFFILLSYWVKRRAWALTAVACWLLGARYLDVHWIIAAARDRPQAFSLLDLAALAAVGGLVVAVAVLRQRGRLLAPVHDPLFARALEYHSR